MKISVLLTIFALFCWCLFALWVWRAFPVGESYPQLDDLRNSQMFAKIET